MKNKQLVFTIFTLMVLAQLLIPASMIFQNNSVLKNGEKFNFKLQPIDPSDPFRGEYIVLAFTDEVYFEQNNEHWQENTLVYAIFENDKNGYAYIAELRRKAPKETANYLALKVDYVNNDEVYFNFPFNRFYMSEDKAQKAENLFLETIRDSTNINYAVVSIKNGKSVLNDVQVNGVSLVKIVGKE